jgi:beta-galactosidase
MKQVQNALLGSLLLFSLVHGQAQEKNKVLFTNDWKFILDSSHTLEGKQVNDEKWRHLNLPHDWSVEFPFDEKSPTGTGGGALRGGTGWYRKTFALPVSSKNKKVFIDFDGVYRNSEVWINGHFLGLRPNGYISFRYELTPYLTYGDETNLIAVRVDNSLQPNSRWYSGSGIYRNVWLVTENDLFVDHWGVYITTAKVDRQSSDVAAVIKINNSSAASSNLQVVSSLLDATGKELSAISTSITCPPKQITETAALLKVPNPHLWSVGNPYLYRVVVRLRMNNEIMDEYTSSVGIRSFAFDKDRGFLLNGDAVKINGVCDHHDLGCLGTAINTRALERQLEILKEMGCNSIRTSHNPPAPELLDLCDKMGFIVMDEAFDMWKKRKTLYDYHLDWDNWHKKDLEDQILRDRNHPSVFIWSIGNEIPEQWGGKDNKDSSGTRIAIELAAIIHGLDTTRPITSACDQPYNGNKIIQSGALDLIGYNYHHQMYAAFPATFPGKKFIGTETVSALQTRGHYDMPSDSIRRWPPRWDKPLAAGNRDLTCSAYDNVSAPWGSTHEETWKVIKKNDFLSGQFIWTGFDYLGEPTPYPWPARSSYFGIIDLAGFPKDIYYLYQAEWTNKNVLHIFPHWNWNPGDTIDIWAYYNHADEVELFLNGKSLGVKKKKADELHIMWRVRYEPGTIRAVSRKNGNIVLTEETKTAGRPAKIILSADRNSLRADGVDLSFVTIKIVDAAGNLVPSADNLISIATKGEGSVIATDNGSQTSLESFQASDRRAFNGLCLAVIRSNSKAGTIQVIASSKGMPPSKIKIAVQ